MEGRVLNGRYRLVSRIAAGSMGQVWRCHDETLDRIVAVKLLLAVTPTAESRARFDREARLAGSLSCPSIVTVHDYGHADLDGAPVPYLIMELLDGRTLARTLEQGRPPALARALTWGVQVCDALTTAHRAGIVHRDIKPDNVMVTADGTVKVLDFGIARFAETGLARGGLTADGLFVGTAEYMSPEQAQGHRLDARSDLYSLGCLLYALLTGRPPFQGDTLAALVFQHVSVTPESPATVRPEIPRSLDRLVMGLLAKDPAERPASAASVRAHLAALYEGTTARSDAEVAGLLHNLGAGFSAADRPDKALRPMARAVELRRGMSRSDSSGSSDASDAGRHSRDLAASLHDLGLAHVGVGRPDQAVQPLLEAVSLYRALAETEPGRFEPDLAAVLTDLGLAYADLGRVQDALTPTLEAVRLHRAGSSGPAAGDSAEVAGSGEAAHAGDSDMARALHNLGLVYSSLGSAEEALAPTSEAVELYQTLARETPDRYSGDLAASLTNLGAVFQDLGRPEEALPTTLQAVEAYRRLAKMSPGRYNADLAGALGNLAFLLSRLGRTDQALGPARAAVDLYRSLAAVKPDRYGGALARALTSLGRRLAEAGRESEAAQAVDEARWIRHRDGESL